MHILTNALKLLLFSMILLYIMFPGMKYNGKQFGFLEKPDVSVCQIRQSGFHPMYSVTICSAKPSSAKSDSPVSETRGSRIFRTSDKSSETTTADPDDWRAPLVRYLENTSHIADRKVWQQALKYVMLDNTLYRRTIDSLLVKCLGSDQSRIAMGDIHEGICGTHQSAHKMKLLLRCVGFY
jgi:hypothetical protein